MPRLRLLALCVLLASSACGGGSSPPSSPGPGGGGEQISGNERLGWNQSAADAAELATFRYAAYVDGNRVELTGVSCGAEGGGFQCSSRMPAMTPGTHSIELVSFVSSNGANRESERSAALQVTLAGATSPADADHGSPAAIDQTTADGIHLRLSSMALRVDAPTALAFAPDGRVFVAERRGRIRVAQISDIDGPPREHADGVNGPGTSDGNDDDVALDIPDAVLIGPTAGGLLDLVLDPAFEKTRYVYALYTTASRGGGSTFTLSRYREVAGRLGERAFLLGDIPASPEAPAGSIGFGADGRLYVALDDGGDSVQAQQASSYSGKVLRLNPDGATPADQPGGSPVYSADYRSPRGFDWHPTTGALWIIDAVNDLEQELRIIGRDIPRFTRPSTRVVVLPPGTGAASMAFYRGDLVPAFRGDLLVAAGEGRHLLRVRFDTRNSTRVLATERLFQELESTVTVVSAGPDGAIYLGTDRALLRIGPRQP
jgi:glucose/arabinose dehydrogenase